MAFSCGNKPGKIEESVTCTPDCGSLLLTLLTWHGPPGTAWPRYTENVGATCCKANGRACSRTDFARGDSHLGSGGSDANDFAALLSDEFQHGLGSLAVGDQHVDFRHCADARKCDPR